MTTQQCLRNIQELISGVDGKRIISFCGLNYLVNKEYHESIEYAFSHANELWPKRHDFTHSDSNDYFEFIIIADDFYRHWEWVKIINSDQVEQERAQKVQESLD